MSRPVECFRPNIVLRGGPAFFEDRLKTFHVGGATLTNTSPCARCVMTTVEPVTGVIDKNNEPLETLRKDRFMSPPHETKWWSWATPKRQAMFGMNGFHDAESVHAMIHVGDKVEVQSMFLSRRPFKKYGAAVP
eukprot:PhM_4_TR6313/c0_g1_i1/m.48284